MANVANKFIFPFKKGGDYVANQCLLYDPTCNAFVNRPLDLSRLFSDFDTDAIFSHESVVGAPVQVIPIPWGVTNVNTLLVFLDGVKLPQDGYTIASNGRRTNVLFTVPIPTNTVVEIVGFEFTGQHRVLVDNGIASGPVTVQLPATIPAKEQVFVYLDGMQLDISQFELSYSAFLSSTTLTFTGTVGQVWEVVTLAGFDPLDTLSVNATSDGTLDTLILPWVASNKMQLFVSIDGLKFNDYALTPLPGGQTELTLPSALVNSVHTQVVGVYGLVRLFTDPPTLAINGTNSGLGTGQVFRSASTTGNVTSLSLRSLTAGNGVTINTTADSIEIAATSASAIENVGNGVEILDDTVVPAGVKSLVPGTGVDINSTSTEISIGVDPQWVRTTALGGSVATDFAKTVLSEGSGNAHSQSLVKKANAAPNSTIELFGIRQGSGIVISEVDGDIVVADANGGNYVRIDSNYTIELDDSIIGVDSTNGPVTITLVPITLAGTGKTLVIKDEAGMSSVNNITVSAGNGSTIDGIASLTMTGALGSLVLYCDGVDWYRYADISGTTSGGFSVASVNGRVGHVVLDQNDVGLGNVDNTSDLSKPISTATQAALDLKADQATLTSLTNSLADVATSGDYADLINTPPTPNLQSVLTAGNVAVDQSITFQDTSFGATNVVDAGSMVITYPGFFKQIIGEGVFGWTAPGDTSSGIMFSPVDISFPALHIITVPNKTGTLVLDVDLATVATTGSYTDLLNLPSIPSAQVNSDWAAVSGVAHILNKPVLGTAAAQDITAFATAAQGALADSAIQLSDLATVATTGSYTDLINTPAAPDLQSVLTAGSVAVDESITLSSVGAFTANTVINSSGVVITYVGMLRQLMGEGAFGWQADDGTYNGIAFFPVDTTFTGQYMISVPHKTGTLVLDVDLATVATTGSYTDLTNTPAIPAAQVNSDWNAVSGVAHILNKPVLGTAAAQDITAFATAAQGALADSAVQPGTTISVLVNDVGFTTNLGTVTSIVTGAGLTGGPISVSGTISLNPASIASLLLADSAVQPGTLALVATSGSYTDLSNRPTIPAAQVNSDWDAASGLAQILNKPILGTAAAQNVGAFATAAQGVLATTALQPAAIGTTVQAYSANLTSWSAIPPSAKADASSLAAVATSGSYTDLTNTPNIPAAQVNSDWSAASGVAQILNKPTTLAGYGITDAINIIQKGANNGVATLDGTGRIPAAQLPPIALSEIFVVGSQAAQLALTVQVGDVVVRTDTSKSYINSTGNNLSMSDWVELLSPPNAVLSVNGHTGVVVLTRVDVGLGNVDNTSDLNKPVSTATQTALNLKANASSLAVVATSGSYNDLLDKPTIVGQVNSDWNAVSGVAQILNKPALGTAAYADQSNFATAAQGLLAASAVQPGALAVVATSGSYTDLLNQPAIPAAQVNSDWTAVSGLAQILNKPVLGTAAYADQSNFATSAQGTLASTSLQPGNAITLLTNNAGFVTTSGVTSVGLSAPVGLTVSNSPVTTTGTLTLTYTAGYQGYTTTEATKLSGITAGATVGATWGTNLASIPANITSWASVSPSSKANSGAIGSSLLTMSTARILGRSTAATGAVEEITIGSGLSLTGGILSATGGGGSVTSVNGQTGIVVLAKADVGLGNVDNTNDLSKPISTATQSALDLKASIASLATVATTGSYTDLLNMPATGNLIAGTGVTLTGMLTNRLMGAGDITVAATGSGPVNIDGGAPDMIHPAIFTIDGGSP